MDHSENVLSADNQQERLTTIIEPWFISGFVDGEGSFHVAFNRRLDLPRKWSIIPEFHVNQHADRMLVLHEIQQYFNCGTIRQNHVGRHNDKTHVFVVRNRNDLLNTIIPFFQRYPLRSAKSRDFQIFADIVQRMNNGLHQSDEGFRAIAQEAFQMNGVGRYRKVSLQEIIS